MRLSDVRIADGMMNEFPYATIVDCHGNKHFSARTEEGGKRMKDNDLITRREVELVLLEKGQRSKRYKLGDIWELNFVEIREALSEYQSKLVRCKDCVFRDNRDGMCEHVQQIRDPDWFCADGERR